MNFVEFLFASSRESEGYFITGAKERLSYRELYERVERTSKWISWRYGSGKEFLLLADNSVFFVVSYLSLMRSGNIPLLVETRVGKEELAALMSSCHPVGAFMQQRLSTKAVSGIPTLTEADLPEEDVEDLRPHVRSDDLAAVVFTSGSTGTKKGVMITHGNLIANTTSIIQYLELTSQDRMMVVLPFYYCYGASLLHTHLRVGGSLTISNSIFLGAILDEIEKYQCTGLAGVPSTYQILINRSDLLQRRFSSLRYMTQAGGKLEPRYIQMIVDSLPEVRFFVMYGATEATARMSYLPPEMIRARMASIGKGIPGVHLEVLGEDGRPVMPGETGEIVAAGDNIMKGYYGDDEGTVAVLKDGRYHTGDLATVDEDGYIYVVGRSKDIIKCAGYRVSPYEIENLIASMEGVDTVAVVSMPDEILGEAIVAVVRCRDGAEEDAVRTTIQRECRRSLPSYKNPSYVVFLEEMPLNSSNKVDKVRLRQMLVEGERDVR